MTSRTSSGIKTTFTYDANGNPTSSTAGEAYSYDLKRRATSTKADTGYVARAMTCTGNDAFDRLKAGARTFRSSILGITSQTDAGGTTTFLRDPTGRVLGQTGPDGETFYYLSDRLGSITGLTDSTGERVNSFGYGPYGEYTYGSDINPTRGPVVPWKFTGGYRDSDKVSGQALYKLGIRYYNPDTGRFTQPDPTGQDPHYLYPVNYIDPTGACANRGYVNPSTGSYNPSTCRNLFPRTGTGSIPPWLRGALLGTVGGLGCYAGAAAAGVATGGVGAVAAAVCGGAVGAATA